MAVDSKVSSFFEEYRKEIIEMEKKLSSIPAIAPEGGGDGEAKKCAFIEEFLKEHGFNDVVKYEAPDPRVSAKVRPSLVVTIPGINDDYNIWVMAHMDVVPTGDLSLWNSDPWTVVEKDGKLIGRGVEDNQQGLVSAFYAAYYYVKNNIKPGHTIKLLFVADEENGSTYGIKYLLKNENLFKKEDLIIIPDGGDSKGETIEIAEKNILWLDFKVIGEQTHGSRPDSGANACLAACDLTLRIHNLEKVFNKKDDLFEPNYSTIQPTKRYKNVDSINIIPGEDHLCFDCRFLPCYKLCDVLKEVDKVVAEVEKEHNVKITYTTPQYAESPATPVDAPVAQALAKALKTVHNIDAKFIGIGGGTVGGELRCENYNAIVWSTLDDQAHQPNEYCIVDNLIKDGETLVEVFKN